MRVVGTGLTVYEDDGVVEGPVVWLDSPSAVLAFVAGDQVEESIVVARGGTTTFLTPALTAGVKGVMTLQGAPESHLGIMSREYGIPCLMSVTFAEGVRSARDEIIPPDGAIVRMDVSAPAGRVLVGAGVSLGPPPAIPPSTPEDDAVAAAGAEMLKLIERYQGRHPGGEAGNALMRSMQKTSVIDLTDASLHRDLEPDEANDLLAYYGWNMWDILAARATEGESGLIPRQEYEILSVYLQWKGHPRWQRMITEEVGVDGLRDIGAIGHREIATKVNILHVWATSTPTLLGRGVAIDLGLEDPGDGARDAAAAMQFSRRLYRGLWNDEGPMFTSARGYAAPVLDAEWLARFRDERTTIEDEDQHHAFQKFNGEAGMLSFLLHFDNRCGVADSGPYPAPDGGWMLVRDCVINETAYPWAHVCDGLPYALTLALFFSDEQGMTKTVVDIGTLFTKPANFLRRLTGYAVYARDTQDTPGSQIRRLDEAELRSILARCTAATAKLYPLIAAMSDRDKILAGVRVYYTDFIAPFARAAGLWDRMVGELGFYDYEDAAEAVYDPIVTQGRAPELLMRHWVTGAGMQAV
jgi:PEP-utilising enzyme, mobile domain